MNILHKKLDTTVLLRTGMRIGELLNTKMNDLHLKDRKIDIYEGE